MAYFFGRHLHKELDVPVGLIDSTWGGTPAEAWLMGALAALTVASVGFVLFLGGGT